MSESVPTKTSSIRLHRSGAAGVPALLVTGFVGVASFWDPLVNQLDKALPLALYDQRGTGESGPFDERLTIDQMADDAIRVIEHLGGEPVHLVGHSAGACIGLIVAARRPSLLRSLTLIAGWTKADEWMRRVFEARLSSLDLGGARAYARLTSLFMLPPADFGAACESIAADEKRLVSKLPLPAQIHDRVAAVLAFDASAWLPEVRCPTLVVGADDDMMTPVHFSEALAAAIPGARFERLLDGGHYCVRTRPRQVAATLTHFLDGQKA